MHTQVKMSNSWRNAQFFNTVPYFWLFVGSNINIKMSSFKSSENIQKKEGGLDRSVSDNQSSSVTLNELAIKARKILYFRV